jgi:uncharacterized protein (TIGR03437 family)
MKKTVKTVENLLTRRESLRLLGAAGATALVGLKGEPGQTIWEQARRRVTREASSIPSALEAALFTPSTASLTRSAETLACVTRPALTEGPYFVDELLNRSDIRTDPSTNTVRPGVPLKLRFNVNRVSSTACSPLAGAYVDIWHCDALGSYSDVNAGMGNPNTRGQKFLRGYQITDVNGNAEFTTIYPGYYTGRTVHIHFKIRLFEGSTRTFEFTSQFFFDDALTDQVFTQAPYNTKAARGTRNNNDGIYSSQVLLPLTADGQGGYTGTFDIGLTGVPNTVATVSAVSAASFSGSGLANEGIAALFGAGLAESTQSASTLPLPTTLGNMRVRIRDAGGVDRDAPLFFVSPTQINFQIPATTSIGSAVISVLRNNTVVGQGATTIESVAPGLFTANTEGQGLAAGQILRQKADGTQTYEPLVQYNQATGRFEPLPIDLGPATDQLYLVAYGTGLRNRSSLSGVSATIGGSVSKVLFVGAQGGYAGLDQANLLIPRSLAGRGNVDVILNVDGKASNTITINVK